MTFTSKFHLKINQMNLVNIQQVIIGDIFYYNSPEKHKVISISDLNGRICICFQNIQTELIKTVTFTRDALFYIERDAGERNEKD